jgi:hypothetical protein
MKLPVYSRADLSRTVVPVVVPFLTAGLTGAAAREFRATDTRTNDHPNVRAPRDTGCGDSRIALQRCGLISDTIDAPGTAPDRRHEEQRAFLWRRGSLQIRRPCITESTMSPETPIVSHEARQSLLGGRRKIFRDAATAGIGAKTRRDRTAKPVERMCKVE